MNDAMKKMKKYCTAVERRLNLPRELKARVMSDFISSIAARREQGMTDEEIYSELGTPKEAARSLNEQMKEFTYRKSPWRFLFLACGIYGLWRFLEFLVSRLLVLVFLVRNEVFVPESAASIGIIGGADGPTAIFVTHPGWVEWLWVPVLLVGLIGYIRLCKCKK